MPTPFAKRWSDVKIGTANKTGGHPVDRRRVLKTGAAAAAATLFQPTFLRAQASKKLSILTWNIADQEALFKEEFA